MSELPGSRGLLISAARPSNLESDIQFRSIGYLDYYQYSLYIIQCLHYHIRTDYVLIVQEDGWVLNGANWNDDWFNYDYIGSPCPYAGIDGKVVPNFLWAGNPHAIPVLCGGFSLRSRALLEAPTKYGICYKICEEPLLRNEDVQICLSLRRSLEARGLRIAPLSVALEFSVEYMHPVVHKDLDLTTLFGQHAKTRRIRPNSIIETNLHQHEIDQIFGENRLIALLEAYGYTVRRK